MKRVQLMQGNQAFAEGALAAGVRFYAGYPITPSTEIAEILAQRLPQVGGRFIQMEDEIASMAAVCGASLTGQKVLTATSGPGFSLKQELLGYAAMAEIPVVVANVQRVGPSTGQPTAPAQGDVMQARWGSHGDRGVIALSPSSVREAFDVAVHAVNFAERFRTPVVVLLDEVIGHMREKVVLPDPEAIRLFNRKRPTEPPGRFKPYKPDADGVPPMAAFGDGFRVHVTGLVHDETGFPTGSTQTTDALIRRLHSKIDRCLNEVLLYEKICMDDAEIAIIAYGCTARPAEAAVEAARAQGIKVGLLRLITIWPFAGDVVAGIASRVRKIIVPEMNCGQLVGEVERAAAGRSEVVSLAKVDSELITPGEILGTIQHADRAKEVN